MFKKEFEEYKQLVGQANAYFELQRGTTLKDVTQPFIIENSTYNGYLYSAVSLYEAKLKSLSVLIEHDITNIRTMQERGLYINDDLLKQIDELASLFIVEKESIRHKNFQLTSYTNTHIVNQEYYCPFIKLAFDSINYLNQFYRIDYEFKEMFVGSPETVKENMSFVKKAFLDLGILTSEGKPTTTDRKKVTLWCLIHQLKGNRIIHYSLQGDGMNKFWRYLQANGKPPQHPHTETEKYKKELLAVTRYFKEHEKLVPTTISDKS